MLAQLGASLAEASSGLAHLNHMIGHRLACGNRIMRGNRVIDLTMARPGPLQLARDLKGAPAALA